MGYMAQALSLAQLALGQVSPNPAVGAVIVKDGEVVGQGYTQPPGLDHAEIVALKQAGERARGGVMYLTLEPCCHHGRTPPCTRAIIAAGIVELHLATFDVNPVVLGRGKEELEGRRGQGTVYQQRLTELLLERIGKQGKVDADYAYPVQVVRFGKDLTLIALAGEVVVDYPIRLPGKG